MKTGLSLKSRKPPHDATTLQPRLRHCTRHGSTDRGRLHINFQTTRYVSFTLMLEYHIFSKLLQILKAADLISNAQLHFYYLS